MSRSDPHIMVFKYRTFPSCAWLILLTTLAIGVIGWVIHQQLTPQCIDNEKQNIGLTSQNDALEKKLVLMDRIVTLDREAYTKLRETVRELQNENRNLQEELSFYKGLASSEENQEKLTISSFSLIPNEEAEYSFVLVLTQLSKNAQQVKGTIEINLIGTKAGKEERLTMKQITPNAQNSLEYQLRYFQRFEGRLFLPEQVIPKQIVIRLSPKGQKVEETRFKWEDLQKEEQY